MSINLINKLNLERFAPLGMKIKSVSPQIMIVAGIGAIVGGAVLACKATLKTDKTLTQAKEDLDALKNAEATIEAEGKLVINDHEITKESIAKDRKVIRAHCIIDTLRAYSIPLASTGLGIFLIAKGFKAEHSKYLGAVAAFNSTSAALTSIKSKIEENLNPEEIKKLYLGESKSTESSTATEIKKVDKAPWLGAFSVPFSMSAKYTGIPSKDKAFLISMWESCKNRLRTHKLLTMEEVWEAFGFDVSEMVERFGSGLGCVYNLPNGMNGGFTLNLFDDPGSVDTAAKEFLEGYESEVYLEFTPHGFVDDLLRRYRKARKMGRWEDGHFKGEYVGK